jgi:KipI family sensor histidine kinase inhibitor
LFVDADAFDCTLDPLGEAGHWLQQQAFAGDDADIVGRSVEIPVRYGSEHGPDLAALAAHAGLGEDDVIARHCAGEYRVAMLGFSPGFPYLLGLDPLLAMPRLDTPRTRVAAGSVGIGGAQTGIYPQAGPGGWRIIGRTALALFDPLHDPPTLLAPGDRVRFIAA